MMLNNIKFICFEGIDGAGKTTLIRSILDRLAENRLKFSYVWGGLEPYLMRLVKKVIKRSFLANYDMFEDYTQYTVKKREISKKHPLLSKLYFLMTLLDYLPRIFFRMTFPLLLGKRIIADRYVFDVAIALCLNFDYSESRLNRIIKRLFYIIPKPDLVFLIDTPEKIAFNRKEDVPSLKYLRETRELYLRLAEEYGMIVLDGRQPVDHLSSKIEAELKRFC